MTGKTLITAFGAFWGNFKQAPTYTVLNPQTFFELRYDDVRLDRFFDPETQLHLISQGTIGYLFGSTVLIFPEAPTTIALLSSATREQVETLFIDQTLKAPVRKALREYSKQEIIAVKNTLVCPLW